MTNANRQTGEAIVYPIPHPSSAHYQIFQRMERSVINYQIKVPSLPAPRHMLTPKQKNLSDVSLWEQLKQGEAAAFTQLFKKYYGVHCAKARYIVKSSYDAEETVQEVFKKLWEHHSSLPHVLNPAAYISQSVRNACLNRIKQSGKTVHEDIEGKYFVYEESMDATELVRIQTRIDSAVEQLPESCKAIFKLSRFEQKTYGQIAEQLQVSPKTVENQIAIALKKLRQSLADLSLVFFFIFLLGVKWIMDVFTM